MFKTINKLCQGQRMGNITTLPPDKTFGDWEFIFKSITVAPNLCSIAPFNLLSNLCLWNPLQNDDEIGKIITKITGKWNLNFYLECKNINMPLVNEITVSKFLRWANMF